VPPRTGLLRADEVAAILAITPRHVRRLAADGRLCRVRLGARTSRYTPESVEALIAASNDVAPAGNGRDGKARTRDAHFQG
jgi:excisionase family DNA binding protein